MITTLLFDFDGTLANTYPIIMFAFKSIFKEFNGQDVSEIEIASMFGPAEDEIILRQFKAHAYPNVIIERYYELYEGFHSQFVKIEHDLVQMIDTFCKNGYKLGIITGKGRRSLDISLRHCFPNSQFHVSIAGDEVRCPKPHPEGIQLAIQNLHTKPENAVYIGDSDFDFKAGQAAGVKTIGVKWFDKADKFAWKSAIPDTKADSIAHLLEMFKPA